MQEIKQLSEKELDELKEIATKVRQNILTMIHTANSGHTGGSLSAADIMSVLYFKCLNHSSEWDKWENFSNRDRFVLSKGHASPVLYSTLAEAGYISKDLLLTFRKLHSKLQGHPSFGTIPGIEATTGSLGQGLSIGNGMALGLKLNKSDARVYVLLGDGELQEGQVWEAAMTSAHYNLGNLTAIVDRNSLQIDGSTEQVMGLHPVADKWRAFGWHVIEIDGHDHHQIFTAIETAKKVGPEQSKPVAIIATTLKGKGISFMENKASWHGKAPNKEELESALKELRGE